MTKAIVKREAVPANSRLAKSERELRASMSSQFEAFYQQGVILERIRSDAEYKDAGFASFDKYLNERQPLGLKRTQAWNLIAATRVRPLLPEMDSTRVESAGWTEKAIRPLTHSDFTPSDQKRLGKKIATRVKRGEPLTATLVKSLCDEDRGVPRKKAKAKAEQLKTIKTAPEMMRHIEWQVNEWTQSLGTVPGEFWSDIESDDPGSLKDVIQSLSSLVSLLRS